MPTAPSWNLHVGDCLDVLNNLSDNDLHSLMTVFIDRDVTLSRT